MGLFLCKLWDFYFSSAKETSFWTEVYEDGQIIARYIEWEVKTDEKTYYNTLIQV